MSNNTDWKNFIDHFAPMTCVLSVDKNSSDIRIVTGNQKYIDSLALAAGGVELGSDKKTEFVPDSEYTRYIPKDLNFEDACRRCAVLKEPMHTVIRASRYPFDMNIFFMPMDDEAEDTAYCTYSQVLVPKQDDNLMSLNISREMAASVISTSIKLRGDRPFQEIMDEVIEDIRKLCDASFCCVLLMDEGKRRCSVLGQSRAPGANLAWMETYLDDDFYDLAMSWLDTIGGSYCLVIQDEKDMEYVRERNTLWYRSLTDAGVERLVIFPLMSRGHFLGYIWVTNFDVENTLRIKDTLELTTYFIASEIASNQFIEQLKTMSRTDLLTGILNRNEMNKRVSELAESEETSCNGIVFADMNGLKHVNDTQGHAAGDALLKNAAIILQSTFVGDEIFRAGGDEFFVMMRDTSEEQIKEKIAEIRKKSEMFENVSFSIGYCLLEKDCDIRDALSRADAMMYEDKDDYYRRNGGRR